MTVKEQILKLQTYKMFEGEDTVYVERDDVLKALEQTRWIPIKWHEITDEERVIEEYPKEWLVIFDCQIPDDGERILVQTKWGDIELDECYIDDGIRLDSDRDWIDDIVAWTPLPEPYKEGKK